MNSIYLGKCAPLMALMPEQSIDLIVTDPPYLVNYRDRSGRSIAGDRESDWLKPSFTEMYRILRNHSFAVSFYGWNHVDKFMTAWRKAGFRIVGHFVFAKHYASRKGFTEARHECAYLLAKGNPHMKKDGLPDVMPWGRYTGNRLHPTQKPLEILRPLIKTYSEIGDVILDPFAGSGSTALAAKQLGRSWIGMEMDATYHQSAVNRLNNHTQL
ncbi:MAG: DNA methylase [Sphaerospermopsis sp. SIO1G2]|nr:DNA methylase [Sphaerospermopsis sp. SIO1G2]